MARVPDLVPFCKQYALKMVTVAEVVRYRLECDYELARHHRGVVSPGQPGILVPAPTA